MEQFRTETLQITEENDLVAVLRSAGIAIESWGTGAAKTVGHLLEEIKSGETRLYWDGEGSLVRSLAVAWVDVWATDATGQHWHLREEKQVFRDGRERRRQLQTSLGEKMLPDEDIVEATYRALGEELGVQQVDSVEFLGQQQTVHTPDSYPGLASQYDTYTVRVDLPASEFVQEGYVERQADKSTFFVWEPVPA